MHPGESQSRPTGPLQRSAGATSGHSGWVSPEVPGTRIAGYTLVSMLGEGGFGVVWLADQREPIVRRVALKIIKPGMDSAAVVARFEQERQTLALMDHPNIARVYDAGVTGASRPYFVMEYVPGRPITDHADATRLSVRDRLGLMARVCDAVQHAHGKGVIHRDLKPSNVLVEVVDGVAAPKVIDFGIAKAVRPEDAARTQFTSAGTLIGTPEYMSPEQAAGVPDIDTRTDVYSLGVLLYELLTGHPPFDSGTLRAAGLAEIQRIIREVEPPRPSARLGGPGPVATNAARARQTQHGSLVRTLRRELEWIPLKAMRKDRDRRYATAQEMAADIRRYLSGEALLAGPESRVYRARKFVSRNRVWVGAAGAVLAAIIGGTVVSASYAMAERRARIEAVAAGRRAAFERDTATLVNSYLVDDVLSSGDPDEDGVGLMVETVLARAADNLETRLGDRPEIQMRVAATLGRSLVKVGRPELALSVLTRAKALASGAAADAPGIETILLDIDEYLGESMYRQADAGEAAALLQARLAALGPGQDSARRATILNQLGGALKWSTPPDLDGAEAAYTEALGLRTSALGPTHVDVLITRHNLALVMLRRAQRLPAEPEGARRDALEAALARVREVLCDTTGALGAEHSQTLAVRAEEARLLGLVGRAEEARVAYAGTIDAMRRVLTTRHWRTLETLGNASLILRSLGRTEEEVATLQEAAEGYRFARGPTDGGTQTCAQWLADALERAGCAECAARALERLHADLIRAKGAEARAGAVAGQIASIYQRAGDGAKAEAWRGRSSGG